MLYPAELQPPKQLTGFEPATSVRWDVASPPRVPAKATSQHASPLLVSPPMWVERAQNYPFDLRVAQAALVDPDGLVDCEALPDDPRCEPASCRVPLAVPRTAPLLVGDRAPHSGLLVPVPTAVALVEAAGECRFRLRSEQRKATGHDRALREGLRAETGALTHQVAEARQKQAEAEQRAERSWFENPWLLIGVGVAVGVAAACAVQRDCREAVLP